MKKSRAEMRADIKDVPVDILEKEIDKRYKVKDKEKDKIMEDIAHKKWLNRPYCDFVGRAYAGGDPSEFALATVQIKGNMGHGYKATYTVPSSVNTYFHNMWTDDLEREFGDIIRVVTQHFLDTKIETNPNVIAGLICISDPHKAEQKEDWEKAAIEKLCEFSLEDLKYSVKNEQLRFGGDSHGQGAMLKKALAYKIKLNIPDKKRVTLPTEWKILLSIDKMKRSK